MLESLFKPKFSPSIIVVWLFIIGFDNFLKYINPEGRVLIDLMKVIQ